MCVKNKLKGIWSHFRLLSSPPPFIFVLVAKFVFPISVHLKENRKGSTEPDRCHLASVPSLGRGLHNWCVALCLPPKQVLSHVCKLKKNS